MSKKKLDHYVKIFQDISSNQQLHEFLISQSKKVPDNHALRTSQNYVYGCQSDIWMCGSYQNNQWQFQFDSNSQLVKGLGSILLDCLEQCCTEEIANMNFFAFRQIAAKLPHQKQKSLQLIINRIHNIIGRTV